MSKNQRVPQGKEIKPTFFVFCEGKSEEAYVSFLRSQYRIPIEISAKISGNKITQKYITNTLRQRPQHPKDKQFLMFDNDVEGMLEKLQSIKIAVLLSSDPCFEIWYILHYINQTAHINTIECVKKLQTLNKTYQKGVIYPTLKEKLIISVDKAIDRAKKMKAFKNPSTSVYLLIEELNRVKNVVRKEK